MRPSCTVFTPTLLVLSLLGCDASDAPPLDDASCVGKCDAADTTTEAGRALAPMARFEAVRASGPADNGEIAEIDFTKLDLTPPGALTFHVYFPPLSDDEGDDVPQADLFQVNFDMTPTQFQQIFGLDAPAVEFPASVFTEGFVLYQQRARAEPGPDGGRHVFLDWDNADEEDTRKGSIELEIDPGGDIASAHMIKQAKRRCLVFGCGWDVVFDDTLVDIERQRSGLGMRTDGFEIGRATDLASIQAAVDDPTIPNFRRLAQ